MCAPPFNVHPPQCSCPLSVHPPSVFVPPFGYLRCFKSDFNAVKRKIHLFNEQIQATYCVPHPSVFIPLQCLFPYLLSQVSELWIDVLMPSGWGLEGILMRSEQRLNSVRIAVLYKTMFKRWVSGMENCKVKRCLEGV